MTRKLGAMLVAAVVLLIMSAVVYTQRATKPAASAQGGQPDSEKVAALENAYKSGVITKEEYEAKKRELFAAAKTGGGNNSGLAHWQKEHNPLGFELEHPTGWRVQMPDQRTIFVGSPDTSSFVLTRAFLEEPRMTSRQMVEDAPRKMTHLFPEAQIEKTSQISQRPDQSVVEFRYRGTSGEGRAALLCWRWGASGMMFVIAAPRAQFEQQKPALVRILETLRFTGVPGDDSGNGGSVPQIAFRRFQDPVEAAFTVEVPQGWRVQGGAVRVNPYQNVLPVSMYSPDGKVWVYQGDPNIPMFITPELAGGYPEGSMYPGTPWPVRRMMHGAQFVADYARTRVPGAQCTVERPNDRGDVIRFLAQQIARYGVQLDVQSYTAGDVKFSCNRNGQSLVGYAFVITYMTSIQGMPSMWSVNHVSGFVAPADQVPVAVAVLAHMNSTFQIDPKWFGSEVAKAGEISRILAETSAYISRIQSESYRNASDAQARMMQNWSDATLGIQRVKDPNTGQEYEAMPGSNVYWRLRNSDKPIGTLTTDPPPHADVTQLNKE